MRLKMNTDHHSKELEDAVESARIALATIGKALLDDESMKLLNLIDEVRDIEEASGIAEFGTAAGGFASQIGRLGAVLEQVTRIAGGALDASGLYRGAASHAPAFLN
jgi:hypothetical protein